MLSIRRSLLLPTLHGIHICLLVTHARTHARIEGISTEGISTEGMVTTMNPAKTAELIEMSYNVWADSVGSKEPRRRQEP